MAHFSSHPEPLPAVRTSPPIGGAGDEPKAAHVLLSHGVDKRHESRRILVGATLLLVAGVVALNLGLYHEFHQSVEQRGWSRLEDAADLARDEVSRFTTGVRRTSQSLARDPATRQALLAALHAGHARVDPDAWAVLTDKADHFGFESVQLAAPEGTIVTTHRVCDCQTPRERVQLVARALIMGEPVLADPGVGELVVALPLGVDEDGHSGVLLVHDHDPQLADALGRQWRSLGQSAGAFLVRTEGDRAVVLTDFSHGSGLPRRRRVDLEAGDAMAVAMAATGVESRAEVANAQGKPAWVVTRSLPELGWGLVAQVDRAEMLAEMRSARQGLLLLDLLLLGLLGGGALLWWRFYRAGIARHEAQLTERHAQRIQSVFDTAFDAIVSFEPGGRVRAVNRSAERLMARSAAELDGQPITRHLDFGGGDRLPAAGSVGVGYVRRNEGDPIPVEFSIGAAGEGDERLVTAIVRDVRERVEAEQRLRAFAEGLEVANRRLEEVNAQLEEASRLKSEFLANTSHELRTPLNGMIGFLQLVLDDMCDSPEEEREFLKQALQCSRHLLGLINDVLDIAKIEAGRLQLETDRIDPQQLFGEVYTLTHVQAAQKGIALEFDSQVDEGLHARGDFGKVKQVLINLVGNSLKFTPKGRIIVRAKAHPSLGHFMFEVQDTGIGIPPDRQKLIFEKFVQADGSTTRRFGGTGLGLAISRSLIELMGGIIGVHSEGEGHGTRMYFSLPMWRDEIETSEAEQRAADDQIKGPNGGALVLIVEDDPVFRRFLTAVLQQSGYRTVEADHAESGWMLVRRLRPAVVVLDYALSCGDGAALRTGWDLATRMTSEAETRHTPIVFVTGFDRELKDKLRATAFARRPEHLVKPVEASQLIERINAVALPHASGLTRVLMADDDPTVAAYMRKVLPEKRFHLEITTNGEECLHALRTQPHAYDLLILDLMMPEVSGYDVLREMTLSQIRPDLPVLVLTNFPEARNEEERRLLEHGLVLDVVAKTSVHDNPQLLPHLLDWHLQVARGAHGAHDEREAA